MLTSEGKVVTDKATVRRVEEAMAKKIVANFEGVEEIDFGEIRKENPLIGGYTCTVNVNSGFKISYTIHNLKGTEESLGGFMYKGGELEVYSLTERKEIQNFDNVSLEGIAIQYIE